MEEIVRILVLEELARVYPNGIFFSDLCYKIEQKVPGPKTYIYVGHALNNLYDEGIVGPEKFSNYYILNKI